MASPMMVPRDDPWMGGADGGLEGARFRPIGTPSRHPSLTGRTIEDRAGTSQQDTSIASRPLGVGCYRDRRMIPIRDENPTRGTPLVTLSIIAINLIVFFYQMSLPSDDLKALILRA